MNKRITYIDAIRVFSILCIILIHSTGFVNYFSGSTTAVTILGDFGRFSVTLFIFLSGFSLALKYKNGELRVKEFFISSFFKLIPAYLIWNILYQVYDKGGLPLNISSLKDLILGSAAPHLYFVPVLIGLYVVFPFIWKFRDKILYFLTGAFIIQIISQIVRADALSAAVPIAKDARALFPLFLGYFVLGVFCAINFSKFESVVKKYGLLFIFGVGLAFILNIEYRSEVTYQLYYLTSIPVVFLLFRSVSDPVYSKFAQAGYYIYLMHYLVLEMLMKIQFPEFIPLSLLSILLAIVTYGICYVVSIGYMNTKDYVMRRKDISAIQR